MESILQKELDVIGGYIRINYCTQSYNDESCHRNTIIENGILLIIHKYCKPLLLKSLSNARDLSWLTAPPRPGEKIEFDHTEYELQNMTFNAEHLREIKQTMNSATPHYKLAVVGARRVGKTCLLISYTTNAFPSEWISVKFDNHAVNLIFDGKPINLGLWDTLRVGQNRKRPIKNLSYHHADIFMICMDVHDQPSYDKLDESGMWSDLAVHTMAFCQELKAYCPLTPRILVGTKIDLRQDEEYKDKCYTREEMETFAELWECDGYTECSALTQEGLKGTFDYVIEKMMEHRREVLRTASKKGCIIL